jgi:hypothetical protein
MVAMFVAMTFVDENSIIFLALSSTLTAASRTRKLAARHLDFVMTIDALALF